MSKLLKKALKLRSMSEAAVRESLGEDLDEEPESDYQGLEEVLELQNRDEFPGRVFLQDGRVRLVYLSDGPLEDVSVKDIEELIESDGTELRSRAGKSSTLHVHAGDGIAYSADGSTLDFAEFFPPCSVEEYIEQVYQDPGPFRR